MVQLAPLLVNAMKSNFGLILKPVIWHWHLVARLLALKTHQLSTAWGINLTLRNLNLKYDSNSGTDSGFDVRQFPWKARRIRPPRCYGKWEQSFLSILHKQWVQDHKAPSFEAPYSAARRVVTGLERFHHFVSLFQVGIRIPFRIDSTHCAQRDLCETKVPTS